jgi:hypothetical protein
MNDRLTRRQVIAAAGGTGLALAGGGAVLPRLVRGLGPAEAMAATGCATLTPDLTEGPYWVDLALHRSDVTANTASATTDPSVAQAGVPLTLTIRVAVSEHAAAGSAMLVVRLTDAQGHAKRLAHQVHVPARLVS